MEYFTSEHEDKKFRGFSLIQIATFKNIFLIDSITLKNILSPYIKKIMENEKILKILHGCGEDLKILYSYL